MIKMCLNAVLALIFSIQSVFATEASQLQGSWAASSLMDIQLSLSEDGNVVWKGSVGPVVKYRTGTWSLAGDKLKFHYSLQHDVVQGSAGEPEEIDRTDTFVLLEAESDYFVIQAGNMAPQLEFNRTNETVVYDPPSDDSARTARFRVYRNECRNAVASGMRWKADVFCTVADDTVLAMLAADMEPVAVPAVEKPLPEKMYGHWCEAGIGLEEDKLNASDTELLFSKETVNVTSLGAFSWSVNEHEITLRERESGQEAMRMEVLHQKENDLFVKAFGTVRKLHAGACPPEALASRYADLWGHALIINAPELLDYLYENRLGLEAKGSDLHGNTPLTAAVKNQNIKWVEKLVEIGVDVNMTTDMGDTPLDIAEKLGDEKIRKYLESHGAKRASSDG